MAKKIYDLGEVFDWSIPTKPFTIRKDAPTDIIESAKSINNAYLKKNARPIFRFEDSSLNDDWRLDYTRPVLTV